MRVSTLQKLSTPPRSQPKQNNPARDTTSRPQKVPQQIAFEGLGRDIIAALKKFDEKILTPAGNKLNDVTSRAVKAMVENAKEAEAKEARLRAERKTPVDWSNHDAECGRT